MEWIILIVIIAIYFFTDSKIKELKTIIKRNIKEKKGENKVSRIINDLKDKECIITKNSGIALEGTVLDSDEEWVKLMDKKSKVIILRIDEIDQVNIISEV